MYGSRLADTTLDLVKRRPRNLSFRMISEKTGLSVHWLRKYNEGDIVEPGVCKIERLYEFLTGDKIECKTDCNVEHLNAIFIQPEISSEI